MITRLRPQLSGMLAVILAVILAVSEFVERANLAIDTLRCALFRNGGSTLPRTAECPHLSPHVADVPVGHAHLIKAAARSH